MESAWRSRRRARSRAWFSRCVVCIVVAASAIVAGASADTANATASTQREPTRAPSSAAPVPLIPWVALTSDLERWIGSDDHSIDDAHDCVGVLLSPRSAITSAACLVERLGFGSNQRTLISVAAVALTDDSRDDAQVGDFDAVGSRRWELIAQPLTRIRRSEKAKLAPGDVDIVVVQWKHPVTRRARPAALSSSLTTTTTDALDVLALSGSEELRAATVGSEHCPTAPQDGGRCIRTKWSDYKTCQTVRNQGVLVATTTFELPPRLALVSSADSHCDTTSAAFVSTVINVPSSLEKLRDVRIPTRRQKRTKKPKSSSSAGSNEDSPNPPQHAPPQNALEIMLPRDGRLDINDSSSGSGGDAGPIDNVSDSATGSTADGRTDDDSITLPLPLPMYVPSSLALLSAHENISDAARSGGLGVFVSPRHVLTRANWIGSAPLRFAHAGMNPAVAVRRVRVQDPSQAGSLVVVELEEDAVGDWFRVLATDVPFFQELFELQSNTMTLTPRAPPSDTNGTEPANSEIVDVSMINFLAREESGKCPPTSHKPNTFVCAQSSRRVLQDSITPGPGAFLTLYGILVGLADTSKLQNEDGLVSQGFPMLATPSTRAFLDFATHDSIEWMDGDLGEVQDMMDTSRLAVFHRNDTAKTLDCRGVFIAERFVLTTATCVADANVRWVSLDNPTLEEAKQEGIEMRRRRLVDTDGSSDVIDAGSTEDEYPSIVRVRRITIHPLYEQFQAQKHDIAIVEVAVGLVDASVLRLPSSPLGSSSRSVEVDTDTHQLRLVRIVDPSQCRSLEDPLCVEDTVPETAKACVTRRKILPATRILMHTTVVDENMLAGFAYPQEDSVRTCSGTRQFVSVFANQNFINALVHGHKWGEVPALVKGIAAFKGTLPQPQPTTPSPTPTAKPFVVGLRMTKNGQNFCGGTLIAPQYVLTAAHCVSDNLANWVSVGSVESAGQNTESIQVFRVYEHPYYGWPYKFSNDVAVLELKYSASAAPITIDASAIIKDGRPATMFGYGVESPNSNVLASVMHARQLSLVSPATCAATLPNIDASVLCATAAGGFDACTGDSGSPLVVKDPETHADQVIGIVSAGYGCGIEGIPGLYARASTARDFIDGAVVRASWSDPKPLSIPTSEPPSIQPTDSPSPGRSRAPSIPESHRTSVPPPLEERSNNVNVPVTTPPTLSRSTPPAVVGTPLDDLSAVTKSQFFDYLFGDISYPVVSRQLLDALTQPSNEVLFFSVGDVTGLKSILRKYDERPLNQREDRFGTVQHAALRVTNTSRCTP